MSRILAVTVLAVVLTAVALVQQSSRAIADVEWCLNDPVLTVGGSVVHIDTGVPNDQRHVVRRSRLTVIVPANVNASLSNTEAIIFPMTVTLERRGSYSGAGPVPVRATAVVDAAASTPTVLQVSQTARGVLAQDVGTAGESLTVTFVMP